MFVTAYLCIVDNRALNYVYQFSWWNTTFNGKSILITIIIGLQIFTKKMIKDIASNTYTHKSKSL